VERRHSGLQEQVQAARRRITIGHVLRVLRKLGIVSERSRWSAMEHLYEE